MVHAYVLAEDPLRPWLAERSRRSLLAAGFPPAAIHSGAPDDYPGLAPVLLLRAGQILANPAAFSSPPDTRPLLAAGLPSDRAADPSWHHFHACHGGDYPPDAPLPPVLCEWHNSPADARARLLGRPLPATLRRVHWTPLDLADTDDRTCVWQIVTSLQHGGAERIALALATALPRHDISCRLVVLGKPHRRTLDAPPGTLDLSHIPHRQRAAHLANLAVRHGADVLHVHLTDARETTTLAASGIPVIATIHNSRPSWPRDWESLPQGAVRLQLACSLAVESELRHHLPHIPTRTVWNGINPEEFPETRKPQQPRSFTLACIANPRPQKQLHRLPAILAATLTELSARGISSPDLRLIVAGEISPTLPDSRSCRQQVDDEAHRHGLAARFQWTDGITPVRDVLARSHALVSCSAYEGLSLAHLEALASGIPVVACDTGGTRELAHHNPAVTLLPPDASPATFARHLADALLTPPPSARPLVYRDFHIHIMAERVARFAKHTACQTPGHPDTIWFITNNLSTGGAQSSLRRLAKSFHADGIPVRLALLQEYPDTPTAGRTDLLRAGIPVFVPPPAGVITPQQSADRILDAMACHPPAAVVFWNAIPTHKLLLADTLPFTRIYDISPGEMFFTSLDRCLAQPVPGLPCRTAAGYGRLLSGVVVKYAAEAPRAAALGAPVHIIPNGVPCDDTRPPRPAKPANAPLVFATAVRISPQKHLADLILAFRLALPSLPPAVLRIAGGIEHGAESHAADLRRLAADLPVEWPGEIHDLAAFHRDTDVFTMISDPAGCPNASLEALAAGLPVIATDVGGASEQIVHRVTGLLVPPREPDTFAHAMIELARNPALRASLAATGHTHIKNHFSMPRMKKAYLDLFG